MTEIIQSLFTAVRSRLTLPDRHPWDHDHELALLAKIAASVAVQHSPRSGVLYDLAGEPMRVWRSAPVNVAGGATDSAVVAAVAGKIIRVVSVYALAGEAAMNLTFNTKPAGAGTAISALLANAIRGGEVLPHNDHGWFDTAAGEGLSVTTGAGAGATGLQVNYVLMPGNYVIGGDGLAVIGGDGLPTYEGAA